METTIAIIGATGKMGSNLALKLSKAGHRVLLNGRSEEKLQKLSENIKAAHPSANLEIVNCNTETAHEADIIIIALKYPDHYEVSKKIMTVAQNKIVISIANPFDESFNGFVIPSNTSAAEELARQLPRSKVVKAFNTILADNLQNPPLNGESMDCFIAGDDKQSVDIVASLVSDTGLNPVVAGGLQMSRTLENMMLLLTNILRKNRFPVASQWKILNDQTFT